MASSDVVTEVEMHPEIQEVEIEAIPVELPVETVETTVETGADGQPMIALQPLPEPGRDEIILQTQEEIVGSADALAGYHHHHHHHIPVPTAEDISIETSPASTSNSKRAKRAKRTSRGKGVNVAVVGAHSFGSDLAFETDRNTRKWEQKQVQIKTLEGEFSVTMWASGADDGKRFSALFIIISRHYDFHRPMVTANNCVLNLDHSCGICNRRSHALVCASIRRYFTAFIS